MSTRTNAVELVDTTLRDGEQCPGVVFAPQHRLAIAGALADAGIDEIEAGTPAIGLEECQNIRAIVNLRLGCRITAWCRARRDDLEDAASCGVDSVHLSFPVSDILLRALRKCRQWLFDQVDDLVRLARGRFEFVSVGAQDASRADRGRVLQLAARVQALGVDRFRLADTVGIWDALSIRKVVRSLRRAAPRLRLGVHMHNDLGMATANSLAALQAGASWADVTVLGLGERAGNAALEQLSMALRMTGVHCNIRHQRLSALASLVAAAAQRPISASQPIVGTGVFDHESGIHVHALLRDSRAYEPFSPQAVGRSSRRFVLGRHSGCASLCHALREMGIEPDEQILPAMLEQVRQLSTGRRTSPSPADLRRLYEEAQCQLSTHD